MSTDRFVVSDTHFGHENILEYDRRPFASIEEHDEAMIAKWNAVVQPKDEVRCLGDLAWYGKKAQMIELLGRLNGHIHLMRGNHDTLVDKPGVRELFSTIKDLHVLKLKGQGVQVPGGKLYVSLCHYAMRRWYRSHKPDSWHLYGHSHGQLLELGNMSFDVGVMLTNWQPCPWESIVARMKEKIAAGHAPTEHHKER